MFDSEEKAEVFAQSGQDAEKLDSPTEQIGEKKSKAQKKQQSAEDLSQKIAEISEQLLRLQAEFDNYKKRTAKEKESIAKQAEAKMMLRLLPVYEELELAEKEVSKIEQEPVKKGAQLVLSKLRSLFEKEGLKEMKLLGEMFDPFKHETALQQDSESPAGTIIGVIKKGYLYNGDVLRHAIVVVSSGKKPEINNVETEKHGVNNK